MAAFPFWWAQKHFLSDGHKSKTQQDGGSLGVLWLLSTSQVLLFPIFYFSIKDGLICIWLQLQNICKPDSQGVLTSSICVGKQALSNLLTGDTVINKQEQRMTGDISSKTVLDRDLLLLRMIINSCLHKALATCCCFSPVCIALLLICSVSEIPKSHPNSSLHSQLPIQGTVLEG